MGTIAVVEVVGIQEAGAVTSGALAAAALPRFTREIGGQLDSLPVTWWKCDWSWLDVPEDPLVLFERPLADQATEPPETGNVSARKSMSTVAHRLDTG